MSSPRKLWSPTKQFIDQSNLTDYSQWLHKHYSLNFKDYKALWQWSIDQPEVFWKSVAEYFDVKFHAQPKNIKSANKMPEAKWFEGSTLNYAEHIFKQKTTERPAILFASEKQNTQSISWKSLENETAALQTFLKENGVAQGDRVVGYLPNIPQATTALLATISIGAIWSSCSPDFGTGSVLDRFKQIKPKILITVDGYRYGKKAHKRLDVVKKISAQLPSVEKIVCLPYLDEDESFDEIEHAVLWNKVLQTKHEGIEFTPVSFSHPIWILYSSGTTGTPKAITHGHGGMLLEHLKYLSFHNDVHAGEHFFWFSTTGWMMWNFTQAALLVGATIVLYDGSAGHQRLKILWKLTEELPIHHFGTSAPYLIACMKNGLKPAEQFDLSALRSIGSTGSPLPPEGFDYVYNHIKKDVWLCSMSGGTDICTAFIGGNPWQPVYEGEIQTRALGCALYAFNEQGKAIKDKVGEMVITKPMPCMPVFFWNDKHKERYTSSYFAMFSHTWRHGDWVKITDRDGVVILGRSDTTLNRQGVRIGTAEIYRAVHKIGAVKDSLVVNIEQPKGGDFMPLFVLMQAGQTFTKAVKNQINQKIKQECSPRHVPDKIIEVKDLPYTISGKKMEAPVKKLLMGQPIEKAANTGSMKNPESLDFFFNYANYKI